MNVEEWTIMYTLQFCKADPREWLPGEKDFLQRVADDLWAEKKLRPLAYVDAYELIVERQRHVSIDLANS